MKLTQILVTVVIVAGGLVIYDQLVRESGPTEPGVDLTVVRETVVETDTSDLPAPITLKGTGDEIRYDELERRLALLERTLGGGARLDAMLDEGEDAPPNVGADGTEPAAAGEGTGEESQAPEEQEEQDPLNPRPAPVEELRAFRAKLQWVERQRRLEKAARGISDWLTKQGVTLTNEQRWSVVREALRYQAKAKRLPPSTADDPVAREQRAAGVRTLSSEFKDRLFDLVPVSEAQLIVDSMDRLSAQAEAARRAKGGG